MEYTKFLFAMDMIGTFAFAVSGAFAAMEKKLDPFGVLIIAFATAIGGGTLRDVLVGNTPVSWLGNNTVILVIFFSGLATMLFGTYLKQWHKALFMFDALGLGMFTIIGFEIGLRYNFQASTCIALGTMTACFGGVIRDVMLNKVPLIFEREIYALACIAGGTFYHFLYYTELNNDLSKILAILLIFFIRIVAVQFQLKLPKFYLK